MTNIKISILHCSCKIHVLDKQNWQWFPMNKATWIAVFLLTYTCTIILLTSIMVYTCTVCTPAEKDRHVYRSECRKLFIIEFQLVLHFLWCFCSNSKVSCCHESLDLSVHHCCWKSQNYIMNQMILNFFL